MGFRKLKSIDEHVGEMRNLAESLVDHTYPQVSHFHDFEVDVLRQRQMIVDGYDVMVHFNKANYGSCHVESLEIMGINTPFLPMCLICKLAVKYLGGHELKYAESFKSGRKVYVWSVALDDRGRPIPLSNPFLEHANYEGLDYSYVAHELLGSCSE